MSKEEILKIQTCVLKVNIHCDGCKNKVKKTVQKIDGVYKIHVDSELGRVTVSGNVDPATLIKKLTKSGKHAELWGAPTKNLQVAGNGGKNQKQIQPPPKGIGGGSGLKSGPKAQQLKQLQKGFQDLKMPQLKMPVKGGGGQSQKGVKFAEDDEFSDDEFSNEADEFDDDDDMSDDELDEAHHRRDLSKMKPGAASGNAPKGQMMMGKGAPQPGGNFNGSGKKGGGGSGGGGANHNQNQNHGGKKGDGGGCKEDGKNGHQMVGGGSNKMGGGNGGGGADGGKKGGNDGEMLQAMNNMAATRPIQQHQMGGGGGGKMQMNHNQMGNFQAGQGLPAPQPSGAGHGNTSMAYFQGGPNPAAANPYQQQQLAAAMMNQQSAMGNERFQPMIYARPPPAINYAPAPPHSAYPHYPYPYPPPPSYENVSSDDNAYGCRVM